MGIFFLTLFLPAFLGFSSAEARNEGRHTATCRTYDHAFANESLYIVNSNKKKDRVYFFNSPECKGASCKNKRTDYLISGDIVIGWSLPKDGFRCVYYGSRKGNLVSGFIADANLSKIEDPGTTIASWVGHWTHINENNRFDITNGVEGNLEFNGLINYTAQPQRIDISRISASGKPNGNVIVLVDRKEAGCKVEMRRRGPYMVVESPSKAFECGGTINATFRGLFVRHEL